MEPTQANAQFTIPNPFTIYSTHHRRFASRNQEAAIRLSKSVVDGYCYMTLLKQTQDATTKIRFALDTRAVVFRHSDNGNLHSHFGNEKGSDMYFEVIPHDDGSYYLRADDGKYVSAYDSGGLVLQSSKSSPDTHCVFLIRDPNNSGSLSQYDKLAGAHATEAEVAAATAEE